MNETIPIEYVYLLLLEFNRMVECATGLGHARLEDKYLDCFCVVWFADCFVKIFPYQNVIQ